MLDIILFKIVSNIFTMALQTLLVAFKNEQIERLTALIKEKPASTTYFLSNLMKTGKHRNSRITKDFHQRHSTQIFRHDKHLNVNICTKLGEYLCRTLTFI